MSPSSRRNRALYTVCIRRTQRPGRLEHRGPNNGSIRGERSRPWAAASAASRAIFERFCHSFVIRTQASDRWRRIAVNVQIELYVTLEEWGMQTEPQRFGYRRLSSPNYVIRQEYCTSYLVHSSPRHATHRYAVRPLQLHHHGQSSGAKQSQNVKMAMFRSKKLDIGCFINIKVIRDHTKRKVYEQHETERYAVMTPPAGGPYAGWLASLIRSSNVAERNARRQALRYIIRNTTLPQRMRAQAQLQLSQMHAYTRLTQIRNRCIAGGKGRGVFRDFRMARVS